MPSSLLDLIPPIALSTFVSLGGVWLARTWISARLSESIKHEYGAALLEHKRVQDEKLQDQKGALDAKLQDQKGMLDAKLQEITHVNEIGQLRTSLFFDHQQQAFKAVLNETAATIEQWWGNYDPETYIAGPVPEQSYQAVQILIRNNQLFLDPDCALVLGILTKVYRRSMPFDDGGGGPPYQPDARKQLDDAEFLQPRIASVFQMKIGVSYDRNAFADIALFGIVRFLQEYRLGCANDWSEYLLSETLDAEDAVAFAREQWRELSGYLSSQLTLLRAEGWIAHAKYKQLARLMEAIKDLRTKPS